MAGFGVVLHMGRGNNNTALFFFKRISNLIKSTGRAAKLLRKHVGNGGG